MGKVYISAIEAGIDTDEVTARPGDVLVGKTTIDDEGEVVNGTMPDNSTRTSNGNVPAVASNYTNIPTRQADFSIASTATDGNNVFNMSPPKGYYPGNGQSYVNVPLSTFGNARQNQVLSGSSFTSENGFKIDGTIPRIANDMQSPLHGPVGSSHYRVHLPGNGYYEENNNRPSVLVDLEQICNNIGVDTSKMLDTLQIGNRRGNIPYRDFEQPVYQMWIDNYDPNRSVCISFPEGYYRKHEADTNFGTPQWSPRVRISQEAVLKSLGLWDQTVFDGASFFGFMKDGAVYDTQKTGGPLIMLASVGEDRIAMDNKRHTGGELWCYYSSRYGYYNSIGFATYRPIPFWIYRTVRLTFSIKIFNSISMLKIHCRFLKKGANGERPIIKVNTRIPEIRQESGEKRSYVVEFNSTDINEFAFMEMNFEVFNDFHSGRIEINKIELLH